MKILVVGDAASIFIKQYIEYVLLGKKNQVVLLQEGSVPPDYRKFYEENGVALEPLTMKKNRLVMKLPIARAILGVKVWAKHIVKKYGRFDIVHVHGLNRNRGNIGKFFHTKADRVAITVWGDEIFRKTPRILKKYKAYYDRASVITVSTKAMRAAFLAAYGDRYTHKLKMNKFAIGAFDYIDRAKALYSREEICKEFHIANPEKLTVFVGHNGREAQRHIEITETLAALSKEALSRITLVYTMTYGVKGKEYLIEMKEKAAALSCDFVVLEEFLNEEKIAKLRLLCDVLLHAQLTDAFSASIQESLYAGAVVFNGEWLAYSDLPNASERLVEYSNLQDMVKKLEDVVRNYESYREKFRSNEATLRDISSREITTVAWKATLQIED